MLARGNGPGRRSRNITLLCFTPLFVVYTKFGIDPYGAYAAGFPSLMRYTNTLSPTITVLDADGEVVPGVTVTALLYSSAWSEASGLLPQIFVATTATNENGQVTMTISPQATGGTWSILLDDGPHVYRHHIDIDTVFFYVEGLEDLTEGIDVYRLAYSEYISS